MYQHSPFKIKIEEEEDFKSLLFENQKHGGNSKIMLIYLLAEVRKIANIKGEVFI